MRSIEAQFEKLAAKPSNRNWSTLLIFAETVYGRKFNERRLKLAFNKLVDKDDYPKELKRAVMADLVTKTNALRRV